MYKKKAIIICAAALILLTATSLTTVREVMSNKTIPFAPVIIIDAGHGGFDGGASGADKIPEKGINLAIALKLSRLAELHGFQVVMVRDEDVAVYDKDAKDGKSKKVSDIHNRLKLAEKYPGGIFLSIHQNKFPQPQYWGAQVFYGIKNEDSKVLAGLIQSNLQEQLQPLNKREIKSAGSNLYLLSHAPNIAVMVECGFLSNPEECRLLQNDEYQQQLAFVIINSVAQFLQTQES